MGVYIILNSNKTNIKKVYKAQLMGPKQIRPQQDYISISNNSRFLQNQHQHHHSFP